MAAVVRKPKMGYSLVSCTITGQAVAANGALSDSGSAISILGQRRSSGWTKTKTTTEINSQGRKPENNVVVSTGTSLELEIFEVDNGSDPNPLETLFDSFDYVKIVEVMGLATGSIATKTGYFLFAGCNCNSSGRTEIIGTASFEPVDIGDPQVVRAIS